MREATDGIAVVAYREFDTAASVRRRLRPPGRRTQTFELPKLRSGRTITLRLIEAAKANEGGVLHVHGWPEAFPGRRIGEKLYDLNFLRESILEPQTVQVWWMPFEFRDAFMALAPDTWSIAKLKLALALDDEHVALPRRVAEIVRRELGLSPSQPIPAGRLPEVESFSAAYSYSFDDDDLRALARLTGLKNLSLVSAWEVRDLSPLSNLRSLEVLDLTRCKVSDLRPLAGLTSLTRLHLSRTPVRDVTALSHLTALTVLNLAVTGVSDVRPLAKLKDLKTLWLYGAPVYDVSPLASLRNLEELRLDGTRASHEDLERLRSALPRCRIAV